MGEGSTVLETLPEATAIGHPFAQFWSGGQEMTLIRGTRQKMLIL